MLVNYDEALRRLLIHEGGYSNDPGDPGGPTKYGITIFDVRKYLKPNATAADVRALTVDQAKAIYKAHYAKPLHFDDLPSGVDYAVFDYGVNSGIFRSAKVLQRLVGVTADGQIGPITLAATAKRNPVDLVNAICDERLRFLKGLSTWSIFGRGWGRRVAEVRTAAQAMARKQLPQSEPAGATVAKGEVKPSTAGKVVAPTAAAAVGAGYGLWDHIVAHPFLAGGGFVVLAGLAFAGEMYLTRDKTAEVPQMDPVPEAGTKPV